MKEVSIETISLIDIVRSTVVLIGDYTSGRSKPLPYHRRILSVGVGALDDPNKIKIPFVSS